MRCPAQRRADTYLRDLVAQAADGQALPSIARMAAGARVAHVTMWQAMHALAAQGVLHTVRGHAVRVGKGGGDSVRAATLLERTIQQCRQSGRSRLPTISALARSAAVPYRVMQGCVAQQARAGVVDVAHRRGVQLAELVRPAEPRPQAERPVRRSESLSRALCRDIVSGVHPAGHMLPSIKQMAAQYGACPRTIRAAVRALADCGALTHERRHYRAPQSLSEEGRDTVVLLARSEGGVVPAFPNDRTRTLYLELERACSKAGVRRLLSPCYFEGQTPVCPDRRNRRLERLHRCHATLGYMVWTMGLPGAFVDELVRYLHRFGRPVAVLDEYNYRSETALRPFPSLVRCFAMASGPGDGYRVGQYLAALGHRHVAYLCPTHATTWSRARLAGLRELFERSPYDGTLRAFTADTFRSPMDIVALHRSERQAAHALLSAEIRRAGADEGAYVETLRTLKGQVDSVMQVGMLRQELSPMFAQALVDQRITAWVGSSDWVAVAALDYLTRRRAPVPERISVVGYDDSQDAFTHNLTSYNFNTAGVAHAMLTHVLSPGHGLWRSYPGAVIELPGFVNQRATCGWSPARVL